MRQKNAAISRKPKATSRKHALDSDVDSDEDANSFQLTLKTHVRGTPTRSRATSKQPTEFPMSTPAKFRTKRIKQCRVTPVARPTLRRRTESPRGWPIPR